MLRTFTFTVDDKTNDVVLAGSITPQEALKILQDIVINMAIETAVKEAKGAEHTG